MELEERVSKLERKLEECFVRGVISTSNPKERWVVVSYGTKEKPMFTGKLPVKPIRSGAAIVWWWPEVGEAATVISPGDLRFGEVWPGSYYDERPAPSDDPDLFLIEFGDGSLISHHRETHRLDVKNIGDIYVSSPTTINVQSGKSTEVVATGPVIVTSSKSASVKAPTVEINADTASINATRVNLGGADGSGVVTQESICPFTGAPHSGVSQVVFATK